MTAHPSFSTPPAAPAPIPNAAEAEQVATRLLTVMDELAGIIEQESGLVRLGRLAQAAELAAAKADLTRRYFADAMRLQASRGSLERIMPEKIEALRQRHTAFRARLQINLTVLATAHAISEGIVRGVSGEMARKSAPQTYGATGRMSVPEKNIAAPIAVSRVL